MVKTYHAPFHDGYLKYTHNTGTPIMKLVEDSPFYQQYEGVPLLEIEDLATIKGLKVHRSSITTYILLNNNYMPIGIYNLSGSLTLLKD